MREYDDDNIRLYTPVLQRVIILLAVIIAVPVVMWTITTMVRTYVAPPKAPTFQRMTETQPADTASIAGAGSPSCRGDGGHGRPIAGYRASHSARGCRGDRLRCADAAARHQEACRPASTRGDHRPAGSLAGPGRRCVACRAGAGWAEAPYTGGCGQNGSGTANAGHIRPAGGSRRGSPAGAIG